MLWGYSGGSQASEFAVELQPKYASELKVKGAALGSLIGNILAILENINATLAGLTPNALLGLSVEYPDVSNTSPAGSRLLARRMRQRFSRPSKTRSLNRSKNLEDKIFTAILSAERPTWWIIPVLNNTFNNDGTMGVHGVPKVPLFIDTAINDEVSPINTTQALADKYCSAGANII